MCQRVSERTCDQSYLVPCIFVFTKFGSFSGLNFTVGGPGGPMLAEGGDAVLVAADPAWKRKACAKCGLVGWAEHNKPAQVMCTTCHNQALNASNRKRKVARQEKRVRAAARHAPPPRVILPGNDEHSPELEAQLREIIRWCIDKTRGPSKVPGVDVINGGFVELKIPATHEVPADESEENWTDWQHIITHRQGFDAWYAITEKKEARELCLWRADPPTLAIEYIQELQARTSEALGLHFAGTPFAHHDFSLIMGDKERGAGNTAGQVVHCDVQHPETFGITYVLGGYGTKVANYTTAEHMDLMRKHTSDIGYSIQDITMQSGTTLSRLYASYLSCFQLTEVNVLERTVPVRAEDNSNSDDEPTPSFFQPGTVSLVNGGFAHAASGLSAMHPLRMILFSAGSQLGVESPYQGYEQKLIGEPDVFWAFAARTAAQRAAWLERAKATILRVVTSQGTNYYASKKGGATLPTPGFLLLPLPLYIHSHFTSTKHHYCYHRYQRREQSHREGGVQHQGHTRGDAEAATWGGDGAERQGDDRAGRGGFLRRGVAACSSGGRGPGRVRLFRRPHHQEVGVAEEPLQWRHQGTQGLDQGDNGGPSPDDDDGRCGGHGPR